MDVSCLQRLRLNFSIVWSLDKFIHAELLRNLINGSTKDS